MARGARDEVGKAEAGAVAGDILAETQGRVGRLVAYSWKSAGLVRECREESKAASGDSTCISCGTRSRVSGSSVVEVLRRCKQILGHASIVTTQRYARLSE
jgi:succinyl-CoA synthetase alpha subunit